MNTPRTLIATIGATIVLFALILVTVIVDSVSAQAGAASAGTAVEVLDVPATEQVILAIPAPGETLSTITSRESRWQQFAQSSRRGAMTCPDWLVIDEAPATVADAFSVLTSVQ